MSKDTRVLLHQSPFGWKNKFKRVAWNFVWFLCSLTPVPLHKLRLFALKLFGSKVGSACKVYPNATIWAPWNLTLDDDAAIGPRVIIYSMGDIYIGKRVI